MRHSEVELLTRIANTLEIQWDQRLFDEKFTQDLTHLVQFFQTGIAPAHYVKQLFSGHNDPTRSIDLYYEKAGRRTFYERARNANPEQFYWAEQQSLRFILVPPYYGASTFLGIVKGL